MSLGYYDKEEIKKMVKDSEKRLTKDINDGFNRVAAALEGLTAEIKGLRRDINPDPLDKPVRLVAPKQDSAP